MRIQRPCHGITAGIFSPSKKLAKRDKTYEYHKTITITSEEYVKTGDNEYRKRDIKHIVKDSKGSDKR